MLAQITLVLANRPMKRNMEGLIRSALYRSQLQCAPKASHGTPTATRDLAKKRQVIF